jgi:hypothetical protein
VDFDFRNWYSFLNPFKSLPSSTVFVVRAQGMPLGLSSRFQVGLWKPQRDEKKIEFFGR